MGLCLQKLWLELGGEVGLTPALVPKTVEYDKEFKVFTFSPAVVRLDDESEVQFDSHLPIYESIEFHS